MFMKKTKKNKGKTMKNNVKNTIIVSIALLGGTIASASPTLHEPFDFGAVGGGIDTASSGSWTTSLPADPQELVLGSGLALTDYATAGNSFRNDYTTPGGNALGLTELQRTLPSSIHGFAYSGTPTPVIYMSFFFNANNAHSSDRGLGVMLTGLGQTKGISMGVTSGLTNGTLDALLHPRLIAYGNTDEQSKATVIFGVYSQNYVDESTALDYGKTYYLVAKFAFVSGSTVQMSMNWYADGEAIDTVAPTTWDFVATGNLYSAQTSTTFVYDRVTAYKSNNGVRALIDEIRVGTSYADVLPAPVFSKATLISVR